MSLPFKLNFWIQPSTSDKYDQSTLAALPSFDSADAFWLYYQYLKRPQSLIAGDNLYLFREGIKPVWEDPSNENGGNFIFKVKKKKSNRIWEDLLLGFVCNSCPLAHLINGVRLKCDQKQLVTMQIWVSSMQRDSKQFQVMQNWLIKVVELDPSVKVMYSNFNKK